MSEKYKITSIEYGDQLTNVSGEPWKTTIQIEEKSGVDITGLIWDKEWASVGDEIELDLTKHQTYGPQFRLIKKGSQANTEVLDRLDKLEYKLERHITEHKIKGVGVDMDDEAPTPTEF